MQKYNHIKGGKQYLKLTSGIYRFIELGFSDTNIKQKLWLCL